MAINLSKGQTISLTKESQGLANIKVGLGWDKAKPSLNPFSSKGKKAIDCDASVFLLRENSVLNGNNDIVYYGALNHSSKSVKHMGDNITGEGKGDDETITVNLDMVPENIEKLLFVVNIYKAREKKQEFGMIKNAYIRILDSKDNRELVRYNLSEDYTGFITLIVGEVYRQGSDWDFRAIGDGTNEPGLKEISARLSKGDRAN